MIRTPCCGDICALAIHSIKMSRERQENLFLTYPVFEFHVGEKKKVLVRNHVRCVWDPKHDGICHVVHVIAQQLELVDEGGKVSRASVQDVKSTYAVDELIKC